MLVLGPSCFFSVISNGAFCGGILYFASLVCSSYLCVCFCFVSVSVSCFVFVFILLFLILFVLTITIIVMIIIIIIIDNIVSLLLLLFWIFAFWGSCLFYFCCLGKRNTQTKESRSFCYMSCLFWRYHVFVVVVLSGL